MLFALACLFSSHRVQAEDPKRPKVGPHPHPTESFWMRDAPFQHTRTTPELPTRADAVVIGSGVSGVSTAYHLLRARPTMSVLLLDARGVCGGATGRNEGGMGASGGGYSDDAKTYGDTYAREAVRLARNTTQWMEAIARESDYAATQMRWGGSISMFVGRDALESAERNWRAAAASGAAPWASYTVHSSREAEALLKLRPGSLGDGGAIETHPSGTLCSACFVFALLNKTLSLGELNLQTRTTVLRVDSINSDTSNDLWRVVTDRGHVDTSTVVFATNAWTSQLVPFFDRRITPVRGQVIATAPQPPLWPYGMGESGGDNDAYFHQSATGEIVLGGFRARANSSQVGIFDDSQIDPQIADALRAYLPSTFPQPLGRNTTVVQQWSGIMGFSSDGLPWVGPVPNASGWYVLAGYSGGAMSRAFGLAKSLAQLIVGERPWCLPEQYIPSEKRKRG